MLVIVLKPHRAVKVVGPRNGHSARRKINSDGCWSLLRTLLGTLSEAAIEK